MERNGKNKSTVQALNNPLIIRAEDSCSGVTLVQCLDAVVAAVDAIQAVLEERNALRIGLREPALVERRAAVREQQVTRLVDAVRVQLVGRPRVAQPQPRHMQLVSQVKYIFIAA